MGALKRLATLWLACAAAVGLTAARTPSPPAIPRASCVSWNRPGDILQVGRSTGGGLDGEVSRTLDPTSGRWAERISYGGMATGSGFDGTLGWSQDRSGASHDLDSDFARRIALSEAWTARRGWCRPHAEGAVVSASAPATEAGRSYAVWRVTPQGGAPIELWTDAATGLPYRLIEQLSENRLIHTYSRWSKLADGAQAPLVEQVEDPEDEDSQTLTFSLIARRAPSPPGAFARPARPRDYRILGGGRSTTVPYEADLDRVYVPVRIDGGAPLLFEIDTGGHLILSADSAKGLKLEPVGAFSSTGGGQGVVKSGFVRLHEIRIGDAVLSDQPAKVLPLSAAANDRGPRPPRAGILGLELFERFAVHLDRRAHTLTLTPLDAYRHAGPGVALPLRFTEDAPQTPGAVAGTPGDVELDVGNAGPAIVEGRWATDHGLGYRFARGVVTGGSGVGGDYRETVSREDLALGPFGLPGELVSYVGVVERGSEAMRDIAANFGEPILAQFDITFDYARHVAWVEPLPGRKPRAFNRAGVTLAKAGAAPFKVNLVIAGSPADRAGLKVGDLVTAVDGAPSETLARFEVSQRFLQPAGSVVTLTVQTMGAAARDVRLILAELVP